MFTILEKLETIANAHHVEQGERPTRIEISHRPRGVYVSTVDNFPNSGMWFFPEDIHEISAQLEKLRADKRVSF